MTRIDLRTPLFDAAFESATVYAKKAVVEAVCLTSEGLESGSYSDLDVRFDENEQTYVVDTYVMVNENGERKPKLENTRPVTAGMWVVTNPIQQQGDRPNNFAMDSATFQKRYESIGDGRYRARGMARIIPNSTGDEVEITPPWGGTQTGSRDCFFACVFDPANPDVLGDNRYILSQNDFQAYGPADEVLG